jgi:tRNA(Ile)-lysidine synthase
MNQKFFDFVEKFKGEAIALAVSGGVDSVAMLHWFAATGLPGVALTVNHGLRPGAAAEASAVKKMSALLGIKHETLLWTGEKPSVGIEAAARKARYDLMLDYCRSHGVGVLLTAHQADDQIETFLMNLGRGSGVYGLGGIRAELRRGGIIIARPLLEVSRRELQDWCDSRQIQYFNDEMNDDENFARVKIRKNRHVLRDRLGIGDRRILLAIKNLARARQALEADIEKLLESVYSPAQKRAVFPAALLFSLSRESQLKFLGEALRRIGGAGYAPRLGNILRLLERLKDDTVATLSHCAIRRLRDRILIAPEGESISFRNAK